ncbi:MAG TPA: M14 family zinc carboxypeptidase [Chthoniobacterales bacterium]
MSGGPLHPQVLGFSVLGREILAWRNFDPAAPPPNLTLLIGGQHGDEPATVDLLESFRRLELAEPVAIISCANPDGLEAGTRVNARGVDPNRNCGFNWRADSEEPPGPAPWSEPETRILRDAILGWRPAKIVALHWALAELDADGAQSTPLAEAMWAAPSPGQRAPYRLRVTDPLRGQHHLQLIQADCPGSLGQWCGYGLAYPDGSAPAMITLELPYDPAMPRPGALPDDHLVTMHERWRHDAVGYLEAVEPGVHAMLRAACRFAGGTFASSDQTFASDR